MAIYPVITSRPAQKQYANIQSQHQDLLTGIQAQSERVRQVNETRDANRMASVAAQEQAQNAKITLQLKQQEIELKRAALSQP